MSDTTISDQDFAIGKLMEAANEYWLVMGNGAFAFRHGPYVREDVSPLLQKAISEGVACTVISQLGKEIDWNFFKEFCPCEYPDTETSK